MTAPTGREGRQEKPGRVEMSEERQEAGCHIPKSAHLIHHEPAESPWQKFQNNQERSKTEQQNLQDSTACPNQQPVSRMLHRSALPMGAMTQG